MSKLHQRLTELQKTLKAPKNLYNSFGKYKYRNAESILEAIKVIMPDDLNLQITSTVEHIGNSNYIKVSVKLTDGESEIVSSSYAREALTKKGMDDSQISGATESYAKKYALSNMFMLDDTKDADSDEFTAKTTGQSMPEVKKDEDPKPEKPASFMSRRRPIQKLKTEDEEI